jgi:uncharacterized protein YyaL (SSP411 family)
MQKINNKKSNRLINEKNPYLLQHAYNPVEWYPWGEEAFERARKEDKPIFLSIGYSTCHWCHVMAHESFEDEEVAEMMNKVFINIKVDREERPDIDSIYMQVCQMITGSGGWPLTVIMTPDKKPFFAGTYFPKESVINRIGIKDLVSRVDELWRTSKEDILLSADDMVRRISQSSNGQSGEIRENVFYKTKEILGKSYDEVFGGFGNSPKFPIAHNLYFLMSYSYFHEDSDSMGMVNRTLKKMGTGGIYDHIGFGFHRYSTDREWLVPHFEKMLYDQALLLKAYTNAWQITREEYYRKMVYEIIDYVSRELLSEDGGFYSAEDADSEGIEGKFYLWKASELREVLGDDYELCKKYFCVKEEGNYRDERTGKFNGDNILHSGCEYVAVDMDLISEVDKNKIELIRKSLFEVREQRVHPFKDKKILTDWNGLMMESLALAGRVFRERAFTEIAIRNFGYLKSKKTQDGLLFHSIENEIPANLDDYAFLCSGLIELYGTTFDIKYIKEAVAFQEVLIKHFCDEEKGGFFFTSDFSEELIIRKKEIYDGAIPSGNSVQLMNLVRLYRITGDIRFKNVIEEIIRCFSGSINEYPVAYTYFLNSLMLYLNTSREVVLVVKEFEQVVGYLEYLNDKFIPNLSIIVKTETNGDEISEVAKFTSDMIMLDNKPTLYLCSENKCEYPINDDNLIKEKLKAL